MIKQTIKQELDTLLAGWSRERGLETLPPYTVEEPPKNISGDFASNLAMLLARQLKANPRALAGEMAEAVNAADSPVIESVEIAGPGFLNIHLSQGFLARQVRRILDERENFGRQSRVPDEKILFEFVSANPTGPLHIGHGRGAAIGDSLARIFAHTGHDITREYYLNDVGNQMNMLALSVETRFRQLKGEPVEFPEDGYRGGYITDIARKLLEEQGPDASIDFKACALREMMKTIGSDLECFDVRFDNFFSEGVIALEKDPRDGKTEVERVCEDLLAKDLVCEQEGALWFRTTLYGDDKDRVLRRSDGRFTYLASDIAYHKNKLERGYTQLVDLWGADHHGYVARMKAAVQALGRPAETLTVILYQLVSLVREGTPVAMSTRAGEFITLEDVVNEVGRDACRFFFLLRAPDSQLEFDLDLAKKQSSDNPVFYVQYVRARCSSILRESRTRMPDYTDAQADLTLLKTPEERNLVKKLASFPDTLALCVKTMSPHHLTSYLMETADLYHRFYEHCRVLTDDRELAAARLALVEGVSEIIKNGLNLLGVSAPERM